MDAAVNGIAIMSAGARAEIGRIRKEGGVWLVFVKRADGYTPAGGFPDFAAALGAIPDPQDVPSPQPLPQERKAKGKTGVHPAPAAGIPVAGRKKARPNLPPAPTSGRTKDSKAAA